MLKSPAFSITSHFLSSKNHKAHRKKHSEEEIDSPHLPWKFLKELLYSLASSPHLIKHFFYILSSLTLPLARVTVWPCLPQTAMVYFCWFCKIISSIPFSPKSVLVYRINYMVTRLSPSLHLPHAVLSDPKEAQFLPSLPFSINILSIRVTDWLVVRWIPTLPKS